MIGSLLALLLADTAAAQHYTMRQRSFTGPDGKVAFSCITQPFVGVAAFVPSSRYRTSIAAIVVPQNGYRAFLARRYPSLWYGAAAADLAAGRTFTPAWRAFTDATRRDVTVAYEAEGTYFGGIGYARMPVATDHDEADLAQVDAAIGNCDLSDRGRR